MIDLIAYGPVVQYGMDGGTFLTLRVSAECKEAARCVVNELADQKLTVEIRRWREKRSLSANAYFHVICDKIAKAQRLGADEVKKHLVMEYGALAKGKDGGVAGVKLPETVDVGDFYPYAKWFDRRTEGGIVFNCYLLYKPTHTLDSAEMSQLIDGTIHEAKQLGIETLPPAQLAILKEEWGAKKKQAGESL